MSLSARDRTRFARHLLLTQLGEAGQERLLEARLVASAEADAGVLEVARMYLSRAGVQVLESADLRSRVQGRASTDATGELSLASSAQLAEVAGSPALREATRALLGALAAVEAIKRVAALPAGAPQDFLFAISSEDA